MGRLDGRARDANLCGSGPYFPPVSSRSAKRAVDYELVPVDIFGWSEFEIHTCRPRGGPFMRATTHWPAARAGRSTGYACAGFRAAFQLTSADQFRAVQRGDAGGVSCM